MADIQLCVTCHKKKAGRYARAKSLPGSIHNTKAPHLPTWQCWSCLPEGQGRGEEEPMPKVINVPQMTSAVPAKREGLALITPLQAEVEALTVETPEGYLAADLILGRIQTARKTWKLKMYGTAAKPGPIPSIRSGLDQLYELNREIDSPLEKLEEKTKSAMKVFKLAELRASQEEERERQRIEEEKQRAIDELERKKALLKTPAAKARVEERIIEVAEELDEVQQQTAPEQTVGEKSRTTAKKIPVIMDLSAFIKGIAEGMVPEDCVQINMTRLRQYFKDEPEAVAMFPGVEIQDDIQIIGR